MDLLIVSCAFVVTILMCVVINSLLVSIAKQGDERKEFIKNKAMSQTFTITVLMLFLNVLISVAKPIAKAYEFTPVTTYLENVSDANSLTLLTSISIIYFITLCINKRKYGN